MHLALIRYLRTRKIIKGKDIAQKAIHLQGIHNDNDLARTGLAGYFNSYVIKH
jgi:hypothetical protein